MIKDRICHVKKTLPSSVRLMAVTKQRNVSEVQEAIAAGITVIGENYVQEAAEKYPHLHNAEKHFIGHLQRNKVKKALEIFDWIDSVDSLSLAEEISKRAMKPVPVLIQVNAGDEDQKSGIKASDALSLIKKISTLPNISVKGLQIVAPIPATPEDSRPYFKEMKKLFDSIALESIPNVSIDVLSMGMTADYLVAVSEGSTMVRIGEGIFGKRGKP
jgi:PLP dependent protein